MRRLPALVTCLGTLLLAVGPVVGHDPPADPAERRRWEARVVERGLALWQANALHQAGKLEDAVRKLEKVLSIDRELHGEADEEIAGTLDRIAEVEETLGNFAEAARRREEVLAVRTMLYKAGDWRVIDARLDLEELRKAEELTEEQRGRLGEARELDGEVYRLWRRASYAEALPKAERSLAIRLEILGDHRLTAKSHLNVGAQHQGLLAYVKAEPHCRQSLEIWRKLGGERHPETARHLNYLASLLGSAGKLAEAKPLYREALEIQAAVLGEEHPDTLTTLKSLAVLHHLMGEYPKELPLLEQLLAACRKVFGAEHPETAMALRDVAVAHLSMGNYERAEPLLRQVLEIRRRVLGEEHPDTAAGLVDLAVLYAWMGEHRRGEPLLLQAIGIQRKVLGEEHPDVAANLQILAGLYVHLSEFAKAEPAYVEALRIRRKVLGEEHPDVAETLDGLACLHMRLGEYAKALAGHREALEICRSKLGEEHPDVARSLNSFATLYRLQGDYEQAERFCRQALEIRKRALGEEDPEYLRSLNELALLHHYQGDYASAGRIYREVLEIRRRTVGEEHPDFAMSLNNLACLYFEMGEYAKAEPLHLRAVKIRRKVLGANHEDLAASLNNLALVYDAVGDDARAVSLQREALAIQEKALGEEHPDVARTLTFLAAAHRASREYAKAEALHLRALAIKHRVYGEEHRLVAVSLNSLAVLYESMGEPAKAAAYYRRALAIRERVLGSGHPDVAQSLHNLASFLILEGKHTEAEQLFRRALEVRRKALGEEHPDYALALIGLVALHRAKGEYEKAETLCRRALEIQRRVLDATFAMQSEGQQHRMTWEFRGTLNWYLSLSARTGSNPREAYAAVLPWKGAILARQILARVPRTDPEVSDLFEELSAASRRLAALTLAAPEGDLEVRRRRIRELTGRQEELEAELSRRSEAYREARTAGRLTPAELQASLPQRAWLVDLLGYGRHAPRQGDEERAQWTDRQVVAFLVPWEGEVRRVELGPSEAIAAAVDDWRRSIRKGGGEDAGRRLRELVWEPLQEHLREAELILISPDGALTGIPFSALPGRKANTYLIEEVPIVLVTAPRLLPGLLGTGADRAARESMLLVGAVDYSASPGRGTRPEEGRIAAGTVRSSGLHDFPRLPATGSEISDVRRTFERRHPEGEVRELREAGATESAFREEAPGCGWLHLATHGFFAPPGLRANLELEANPEPFGRGPAGFHPGLLSGLALAGANTPPGADGDDGILTAVEVAALDLRGVRLAVLSACETGLGQVAGGEGVLGLQRAFQVAGARTTVTSLWSVPDRATRALMERFYRNLWERKLPMLAALREAQLWLLNEGAESEELRRGLELPEAKAGDGERGRLSPYYWAAWVLSGDWR